MRSRDPNLTPMQLEIAMHLANGKNITEIAKVVNRSRSYIQQESNRARLKTNTRTLPQLVSAVIARGLINWTDEWRVSNNGTPS